MKYRLLLAFISSCFFHLFSQVEAIFPKQYRSAYEREVLLNKQATNLELLMVMGGDASLERTLAAKQKVDAFVNEVKSSGIMRLPEAKQMKELHAKVRERFLTRYQNISEFYLIFETGKYNCVSATALFALVLEELKIPYNIQELPGHVYLMAYPETKGISVEMTAVKDASYMPPRKDVSKSIRTLLEFDLTTEDELKKLGPMTVYNKFYNTNSVINLKQLAGIQYFNDAITETDEEQYEAALNAICKAEKLYDVEKTLLYKSELLMTLIAEAKFDSMKDIAYLAGYANLEKSDHEKVYYQYGSFLNKQLILKGHRELADSSHTFLLRSLSDSALKAN